jgi:hypothetical protein
LRHASGILAIAVILLACESQLPPPSGGPPATAVPARTQITSTPRSPVAEASLPSTPSPEGSATGEPMASLTPAPSPPAASSPTPAPTLSAENWTQVVLPVPTDAGSVGPVAILATASGFTVIGGNAFGSGPTVAWVSSDGLTWQTVTASPAMTGFLAQGGGLLHGQVLALGDSGHPPYHATAWRLVNGSHWVPGPVLAAGHDVGARWLLSRPGGFVIVGTGHPRTNSEIPLGTALWFSPDGVRFARSPIRPFDFVYSAGASAGGYFLSGYAQPIFNRPAELWSVDGQHWRLVQEGTGLAFEAVANHAGQLLAVDNKGTLSASRDGLSWLGAGAVAAREVCGRRGLFIVYSLIRAAGWYLATGTCRNRLNVAMSSRDGVHWTSTALPDMNDIIGEAVVEGVIVLAGLDAHGAPLVVARKLP